MAESICQIDDEVKAKFKEFRFRKAKTTAALILKIDREKRTVILDEEHENVTIEEVAEELPCSQPRYVVYSYVHKHNDGRETYPLMFIFVSPEGCKPELAMMYSGSKLSTVKEGGFTKVFETRSVEDLTDEWMLGKLKLFN